MNFAQLFSNPLVFILELLYMLPGILLALSCHEAAHAYAAYKMGDPTAKNMGRLTLDPSKHIDPVGFLCFLFFRFGWAKPVPVNSNNFRDRRKGELLVSASGITTNFLLGVLFTVILALLLVFNVTYKPAITVVQYAISINFMLMVFNLLPIGPLDGTGIIRAILWRNAYKFDEFMNRYGTIILLVLIFSGVIGSVISIAVTLIQSNVYRIIFSVFGLM